MKGFALLCDRLDRALAQQSRMRCRVQYVTSLTEIASTLMTMIRNSDYGAWTHQKEVILDLQLPSKRSNVLR